MGNPDTCAGGVVPEVARGSDYAWADHAQRGANGALDKGGRLAWHMDREVPRAAAHQQYQFQYNAGSQYGARNGSMSPCYGPGGSGRMPSSSYADVSTNGATRAWLADVEPQPHRNMARVGRSYATARTDGVPSGMSGAPWWHDVGDPHGRASRHNGRRANGVDQGPLCCSPCVPQQTPYYGGGGSVMLEGGGQSCGQRCSCYSSSCGQQACITSATPAMQHSYVSGGGASYAWQQMPGNDNRAQGDVHNSQCQSCSLGPPADVGAWCSQPAGNVLESSPDDGRTRRRSRTTRSGSSSGARGTANVQPSGLLLQGSGSQQHASLMQQQLSPMSPQQADYDGPVHHAQHAQQLIRQPQLPRVQPVCPTPFVLGPVCGRGERELKRWRCAAGSSELLGTVASVMADTAKYIWDVVIAQSARSSLRILSAADGCADDTLPDTQANFVPTSVMLAHSMATSQGAWQDQRTRVRLFGGDVRNVVSPWWQQQYHPWPLPQYIAHRFVALDNTSDFGPQLFSNSQCEGDLQFDVVLVRQGLCFCDDPSKMSPSWPAEVNVSRSQESIVCGTYQLEPELLEGRPAYRKGKCVLQWCPARLEWAVLDPGGGAWAYSRGDVGHPALARGPWTVWDGTGHVSDTTFACDLAQQGSPPWHRPPAQRLCCCGVAGDASSILGLLHRVAAILDQRQPHSFGLLHGAFTSGTKIEVDQLHEQIKEATWLYNEQRRGVHVATVLWRTAATQYWLQCDGIILFQPGSRADPFRAFNTVCWEEVQLPPAGDSDNAGNNDT